MVAASYPAEPCNRRLHDELISAPRPVRPSQEARPRAPVVLVGGDRRGPVGRSPAFTCWPTCPGQRPALRQRRRERIACQYLSLPAPSSGASGSASSSPSSDSSPLAALAKGKWY